MLIAATATGTAGVLVFALLPILAGQIASEFVLDDAQTGLITSAYFSVYALLALTAPVWIRRVNWRYVVLLGYTTLLLGLYLLHTSHTHTEVVLSMVIAGAGSAVLLPVSMALIAYMANKERAYGIAIALQQLVPTLLLLGMSAAWLGDYLLKNTALWLGATTIACALCSAALPRTGKDTDLAPSDVAEATPTNAGAYAGLIGLALSFAGFAAMWVFSGAPRSRQRPAQCIHRALDCDWPVNDSRRVHRISCSRRKTWPIGHVGGPDSLCDCQRVLVGRGTSHKIPTPVLLSYFPFATTSHSVIF